MILNDRKLKLNEIADTLKILTERVHHIIHEYLGMRKLCAKWVPRELTFDQRQPKIKRNKPEFLRRCVTMDEIWLHHFTPKSYRQSSELVNPNALAKQLNARDDIEVPWLKRKLPYELINGHNLWRPPRPFKPPRIH
ncbi:uncharacterized protein LOC143199443 [Rhynchophorus ferrugineus]|uniref:uncharacterized protein LOC143199443 n=1 Tax=Rhynchophorus ferrugineus TaxID=354439 RepID=UPI003FCD25B1